MTIPARSRAIKLYLGASILIFTGFGSILAANIIITSPGQTHEFGRGEYQIRACDTWVSIDLIEGATGESGAPEGFSPLNGISIQGLDTNRCANTQFQLAILDLRGMAYPLYRTDGYAKMCTESDCSSPQTQKLSVKIDALGKVSLVPQDEFHSISYEGQTGTYKVLFRQPGILAKDVSRITIQSQGI